MMQLDEILEENSIHAISQKTKIPEEHLETLLANKFEVLKRVKAMGFISILEREYGVDLKVLRTAAKAYYDEFKEDNSITIELPMKPEKKGKSKLLSLFVLLLLGVATWYFLTQYDQKHFDALLEFIDHNDAAIHEAQSADTKIDAEALSISAVVEQAESSAEVHSVTRQAESSVALNSEISQEGNETLSVERESVENNASNIFEQSRW